MEESAGDDPLVQPMQADRPPVDTNQDVPARARVEIVSRFTGKRRPRIKRVCACGCGKQFTTTNPEKFYKNKTHAKRGQRQNVAIRARTNGETHGENL